MDMILVFSFLFLSLISQIQSKPTLTANPRTLSKSGDSVLIQWSGINSPSKLDWLGLYSPPDSAHDNFIGYKFLSSSPTWESGSGSFSLPLTSLRSNYTFRIFRWTESEVDPGFHDQDHNPLPGTKHLLAESEAVGFETGRGPEQIHLSLTGRDGEMRVMFVAEDPEERYVRYGEKGGRWRSDVAVARAGRYEREDMCHAPANQSFGWRDPGWIFDAIVSGLKDGVKYYYQVGSESKGWSSTRSFVSPDKRSNKLVAFLFGDMGAPTPYLTFSRTQDESISTMKWILRDIEALGDKPTFVSHIGDISYARGYSWLWDEFFNLIEPVASKVPYHVCIGNHEYDWPAQPWKPDWAKSVYGTDGGGECGVPYSLRFNMPGSSSEPTGTRAPATRNLYYSFDMGPVHFVYMSTETNFLPGSNQYNFLKHDLESVDRMKTPFVVFQGHRPMYTTGVDIKDAPLRERMIEHLEPLLVKNNVNLALWGHVHRYERFCPLKNFTCGSSGQKEEDWEALPVHVVIGMGGQDWQPKWEPRPDHPDDPVFPQPKRSLYRTGEFGYTRLVATRKKLTLSFVGNHDGEVHDTVEISASGRVLNGNDEHNGKVGAVHKIDATHYSLPHYVWGGSILVLGGFIGYVLGFVSHARRQVAQGRGWTLVKTQET
ncbi:hypothetical protein V6N13_055532 [Hibiscus sabdariffa]|uniref:Purple acid phosphatase n=2 Tax=Hibiscus sabdariffa TaxID=183260 RepID=A0ABR2NTU9_9ROSI